MTFRGIDISYANKGIDFRKLKESGISYVIIRTGYRQKTDDMFKSHMESALAAGLNVGAYCYCMSKTTEEARKEAEYAVKLLQPYKLTYPVYYDMEDSTLWELSREKLTEIALTFLETVKSAGYRAGLYSNPSWLETKLDKKKILDRFDLWLAHWTYDPEKYTKYSYGQKMWQWGAESSAGSNGKLDSDLCFVDYPALIGAEEPSEGDNSDFERGESVLFSGGWHYGASSSTEPTGLPRKAGIAKITNISKDALHPYHLIGESSDVYGWVDKSSVFKKTDGKIKKTAAVVNLRETAGINGKLLTTLPAGVSLVILNQKADKDGIIWTKAAYNGLVGYLNSAFIYA